VSNCTKCVSELQILQNAAQRVPTMVPDLLFQACISTGLGSNSSCHETYDAENLGAVWTQVLAFANVSGLDGQYICNAWSSKYCPRPFTIPSDTSSYFGPKPSNITMPKPSGKKVKVLHWSDVHLDPRYAVGAEGNCTSGQCCRANNPKSASGKLEVSAPLYGAYKCDSPYYLFASALQSIAPLTGTTTTTNSSGQDQFAFSVYTGDLVSHDPQSELSNNYTEYEEVAIYTMLKKYISGPIFPALGNHDTNPGKWQGGHYGHVLM
jgi:hypothetical protein